MYLPASSIAATTFNTPLLNRALPVSISQGFSFLLANDGESKLQRWSSIIGIVTAIVGNILISFALNIQRYAHIRLHNERKQRQEKLDEIARRSKSGYGTTDANGDGRAEQEDEEDAPLLGVEQSQDSEHSDEDDQQSTSYLNSPYWWGGIVLMTLGEAGNFLAYGFAPASIVSPLGVVALISNCVIAPIMLKERFRWRDFWGVFVAVGGAVTVVLSAKQEEKKLGPHEILDAVTRTEFEVYVAITIVLIGILMWASPKYGNKTILIDLGLVGLFGAYTALSTKGVASMLSSTLWRALTTPVTYVLVIVLVGTAVMQVRYVNHALQLFDSTQVIPVQFVMFTLSVIIGSAVLYRDFEKATTESVSKFVGGCALTFFGVFLITSGRSQNDEDDEDDEEVEAEEGEERIRLAEQEGTREGRLYSDGAPVAPSISRKAAFYENGDGTVDSASSTRRSSKVSFPDPRPTSLRLHSSSSQVSSRSPIRLNTAVPSITGSDNTPLLTNPWQQPSEELLQPPHHPGIQTSISSPLLPSEAQISPAAPKPPTTRSSTQVNAYTHPGLQQDLSSAIDPERPYTPARHSISRMMPGPLLSPLSGGLSVIVADSLRRGVDTPIRHRSFKRGRINPRWTTQRLGPEEALGTSPLKNGEPEPGSSLEPEPSSWSRITRARSLSNTLGEIFGGKRQRTERGDEEAGPSGT